ncbi:MAG TPA: hypothetical protein PLX69_10870 [Leptospiraceae bacterium]|nr:hypothetical protein [Leptospiraceae bacterium]
MICLKCNAFHSGFVGRLCPVCSEPLQLETNANRDKLVLGRMREYLSNWQSSGIVSKKAIVEIEDALANTNLPKEEQANPSFGILSLFLEWVQSLITVFFVGIGSLFEPMIVKPKAVNYKYSHSGKEIDSSYENLTEGILTEDNSRISGLDSLSEMDERPRRRKGKYSVDPFKESIKEEPAFEIWSGLRPLFNEYIWWFIGSLLVLTGSIMGIREAWLVLSGINRHLTVLGAVVLYQFLFTALGVFLGTRSVITGRLLSVISLLLLPVSFSVVSDVLSVNIVLGLVVLFILMGLTSGILSIIAKLFQLRAKGFIVAILPSLSLLSLASLFGIGIYSILLSFFPLFAVGYVGNRMVQSDAGSKGLFLLSIYGALSVLIACLNQIGLDGNSQFALGTLQLGILLLWILGLSAILVTAFGTLSKTNETKRMYVVLEVLFLAVALAISSVGGMFILTSANTNQFVFAIPRAVYMSLPLFSSLLFLTTVFRHEMSIHPFMILSIFTGFIIGYEIFPMTNWSFAFASFVPITGMLFQKRQSIRMQKLLIFWGTFVGLISCSILLAITLCLPQNQNMEVFLLLPILATGLYYGFVSHQVGGWSRSALHLTASFGIFVFMNTLLIYFLPNSELFSRMGIAFGLISSIYSLLGSEFERRLLNKEEGYDFQPFDDISLLSGALSFISLVFVSRTSFIENSVGIIVGIFVIMRSFRDRSSLTSFIGAMLLSLAVFRLTLNSFAVISTANASLAAAFIALGAGVLCVLFPNFSPTPVIARKVFYVIRLPFSAHGLVLIRNGLSATSLLYVLHSIGLTITWFGLADQPERNFVILSGVILAIVFVLAFFTRAFNSFYLRGSTVSLALIFVCIGLAAVANRIGRPLPPNVVGLNLSLGIIALWIFSRVLFFTGQRIADWLDNPTQGKFYHHVPLMGMLLLGIVLLLDIWLLQPANISRFLYITPPTFFIGAGLAAFFYSRSINSVIPLHISSGLMILAAALGFSQEAILGTKLIPLDLPGSRWVPVITEQASRSGDWLNPIYFLPPNLNQAILIIRATTGIAFAGAMYALFVLLLPLSALGAAMRKIIFKHEDYLPLQSIFVAWSFICIGMISIIAFQYAFITPAWIALLASALLIFARYSREGNASFAISGILILHGMAHRDSIYPVTIGPIFAAIALVMVIAVKPISSISKKPYSRILESFHAGAFIYSGIGIIYALASLSAASFDNAVPGLILAMFLGLGGVWMQTFTLGISLFIGSMSLFIGAFQWTAGLTTFAAMASVIVFGFSGITSFPIFCQYSFCAEANTVNSLPGMIPYFAFILSIVIGLANFCSFVIRKKREDFSIGALYGSDFLILMIGVLIGIFVRLNIPSGLLFSEYTLISAILLVILNSIFNSILYKKPRHIYFTQTSIATLYIALKPAFPEVLTPEVDAIVALVFGFILTGITTVARRAEIPPLQESTRRFAAIMPVVAAIVLPTEFNYGNAGMATFSAALYAALAITSSNRIYAVLAAVAANLAIFTAIMASNVQGLEVYLAPVGLFTLFLGHIYKENLTEQARKIIRIGGGLLLYLPAAVNISFEMGRASDAMYAVVFGLLCLLGISAGMLFQIRSYLFMGVSFFTLNLAANLLQTGLRDQRMGFILLSFAGLFIIGSLVFYTLKKNQILGFVEKTKKKLAKWE